MSLIKSKRLGAINNDFGVGKYLRYFQNLAGKSIYISLILSVVITLFDSVGIGMLVAILQFIAAESKSSAKSSFIISEYYNQLFGNNPSFFALISVAILIFLVKGLLTYELYAIQAKMTTSIISKTRYNILDSIAHINFQTFTKADIGELQNISTVEVGRLNTALLSFLKTGQFVIMSMVYLIVAILTDPIISLILISVGLLVIYFYNFIIKYFKNLSKQILESRNRYHSLLGQLFYHFKYLKTTNIINKYNTKIKRQIDQTELLNYKFLSINAITDSAREPVILILISIAISFLYYTTGSIGLSMIFIILLFYRTLNNILLIQTNWQGFHQSSGSVDKIISIQEDFESKVEIQESGLPAYIENGLLLSGVNLSLGGKPILKNINLNLIKDTTIALAGHSGSGKTTLASVITGLIRPDKGSVLLNNRPLQEYNLYDFRSKIGFVTQDPVIFSDTIFNNITLWDDKTKENIQKFYNVCQMTNLSELIDSLLKREDTQAGDLGITLSGGQKQRICIARELYREVELLVFDEATSSLDAITEQIIQENINSIKGKMTIIIIAHRLSTIKYADTIFLLENGQIIDSGTYAQLMTSSDIFQKMATLQSE